MGSTAMDCSSGDAQTFFAERFRQQEDVRPGSMEALWAELPASRAANPDVWDQSYVGGCRC